MISHNYLKKMNQNLFIAFFKILFISLKFPSRWIFTIKTIFNQKRALQSRNSSKQGDVIIPPYMISSITGKCNLACKGCYEKGIASSKGIIHDLDANVWKNIFQQAKDIGISTCIVAGGEPLIRRDVIEIIGNIPEIIFTIFTNGLLIDEDYIQKFKKYKNLIPILSIDGIKEDTDRRRGKGVFDNIIKTFKRLNQNKVLFGTSITVTKENFSAVTDKDFINNILNLKCSICFYIEYTPIKQEDTMHPLTENQHLELLVIMKKLMKSNKVLFVLFPGDETDYDGCLASGRGFIHIASDGSLEPCPFAPYSDVNLRNMTLKDALKSNLLKKIREHHKELDESKGGCALANNKDWVENILK
jgi:MoaA/NifB/PqqE/SkfB family radical SAM enzyme